VFPYRIVNTEGDDLGDATYAMQISAGEEIHFGVARFEVLRLIEFDRPDSAFVGMLEGDRRPRAPGCVSSKP
jgi:hypothetical protein